MLPNGSSGDDNAASRLPASDDLLRLVIESATDFAVIAIDGQGLVTVWNVGAERLLGYREQEMLGCKLEVIFTPEDRREGRLATEMRLALRDGRAEDNRWHLRRDGSRFWATEPRSASPGSGCARARSASVRWPSACRSLSSARAAMAG